MTLVADYSFARPSIADLTRTYAGVMRYVLGSATKRITSSEAAALHAAGLPIGIVAEGGAGNVLLGRAQGATDGQLAAAQAKVVGFPPDRPIYAAADIDVPDSAWPKVGDYLDGFAAGLGGHPVGIYGGAGLVQWCLDTGRARFGWVTNASSWHHGHKAPGACLQQHVGGTVAGCDDNTVLKPDWGQWPLMEEDWLVSAEGDRIIAAVIAEMQNEIGAAQTGIRAETDRAIGASQDGDKWVVSSLLAALHDLDIDVTVGDFDGTKLGEALAKVLTDDQAAAVVAALS